MSESLLGTGILDERFERLDQVAADRFDGIDRSRVLVYLIPEVEASALEPLAWQFGALGDAWGLADEAGKRALLQRIIARRRHHGTVWALVDALDAAGVPRETLRFIERTRLTYDGSIRHDGAFNYGADGHWAVFWVLLNEPPAGLEFEDVSRIVLEWKRKSSHLGAIYRVADFEDWLSKIAEWHRPGTIEEVALTSVPALFVGVPAAISGTGTIGRLVRVTVAGEAWGAALVISGEWSIAKVPSTQMLGVDVVVEATLGAVSTASTADVELPAEVAFTDVPTLLEGVANTIAGTCYPLTSTVMVRVNGQAWGALTPAVDGAWSITATPTLAMVGSGVDVQADAGGATAHTTTDVETTLGDASALIWTRAGSGITIGQTATLATLDTWTLNQLTRTDLGAGVWQFATNGASGNVRAYRVPTNAFAANMPSACTVYAKKGAGSQCSRIRLHAAGSLLSVNLDTGVADGAVELESYSSTAVGDGWWRIEVKAKQGAQAAVAFNIWMYDPGGTLVTWNTAGVDGRILLQSPAYLQQSIAQWADPRDPTRYWEQPTASLQPHYWSDSRGPCVVFNAAHYMTANALAAAFQGDDQPIALAVAADNVGVGASSTYVIALARSTVGDFHVTRWPVGSVVAFRGGRRDSALVLVDAPSIANPHEPQGVGTDVYDGGTRYMRLAERAEVSAPVATGPAVFDRFAIGAFVGASAVNHWTGRMRECAAGPAAWSPEQRDHMHSAMKVRYGY